MRHVDIRELEADLRSLQLEIKEAKHTGEKEFLISCYLSDLQQYRLYGHDLVKFKQYMEWYKKEVQK